VCCLGNHCIAAQNAHSTEASCFVVLVLNFIFSLFFSPLLSLFLVPFSFPLLSRFDPILFPFPEDHLGYCHARGILNSANLHDLNGVGPFEQRYEAMCAAIGQDPALQQPAPFSVVNRTVAYALEDQVLLPVQQQGMDLWWYRTRRAVQTKPHPTASASFLLSPFSSIFFFFF